jgi:uncharacterized membrane protein YuzA (DUF378 family)
MLKLNLGLWIALILLVVGGLNWGLVGLFQFDLVAAIFSETLARIVYVVVGLSAIAILVPALASRLSPETSRTQGKLATNPSVR